MVQIRQRCLVPTKTSDASLAREPAHTHPSSLCSYNTTTYESFIRSLIFLTHIKIHAATQFGDSCRFRFSLPCPLPSCRPWPFLSFRCLSHGPSAPRSRSSTTKRTDCNDYYLLNTHLEPCIRTLSCIANRAISGVSAHISLSRSLSL